MHARGNPVHCESPSHIAWTTVNVSEAVPGVPTPLTWDLFEEHCEGGSRRAFQRIGLFTTEDLENADPFRRMFGAFHGRPAINIDHARWIADRTPGTTADEFERAWFGQVRAGGETSPTRARYLPLAVRAPRTLMRLPREITAHAAAQGAWYRGALASLDAGRDPFEVFREGQRWLLTAFEYHSLGTQMAVVASDRLAAACAAIGREELALQIGTGGGDLLERDLIDALRSTARGELPLVEFLARFGYNGPEAFELSAPSWREDPDLITRSLDQYGGDDRHTDNRERSVEDAVSELLRTGSRADRFQARIALGLTRRYLPLREVGKSLFVQAFDVLRAACRTIGEDLHRQGILAERDDVLLLTRRELFHGDRAGLAATADVRRAEREEYLQLTLPRFWIGQPTPQRIDETPLLDRPRSLTGVAASSGVVEGVVRVVSDPTRDPFRAGEILVCQVTDPGWVTLMSLADGLVVDSGGWMSHGAIIARELGLPCVIGTDIGTRALRTGDHVRLDGAAGTVTVLSSPVLAASFDHDHGRSPAELAELLGGKGANLAEMRTVLGLAVPPGFTITTEACRHYGEEGWTDELQRAVDEQLAVLEEVSGRRLGDGAQPLLLSVRSGAAVSMPGMMDTILNVGLDEPTTQALARQTGDPSFAENCRERLTDMFLATVGTPPPPTPREQLRAAIEAVFRSSASPRARAYRAAEGISEDLGTAVNVQAMVFGNLGARSATGVAFSRDPSTGERALFGDVLFGAQGEDVVAGSHATLPVSALDEAMPEAATELRQTVDRLERHFVDLVDVEFTIEDGHLWWLQVRTGKRSPAAALRIAVDMAEDPECPLTREEAVERVHHLLDDPPTTGGLVRSDAAPLAKGLAASPGVTVGRCVFSADAAEASAGSTVLVRPETSPDDIEGMAAATGVLTARGGLASHAAVVARGWGKPAVVGVEELVFHGDGGPCTLGGFPLHEGDTLTIDGSSGLVYAGEVGTTSSPIPEVETLREWAAETRPSLDAGLARAGTADDVDLHRLVITLAILGGPSWDRLGAAMEATLADVRAAVDAHPDLVEGDERRARLTPDGVADAERLVAAHREAVGIDAALAVLDDFVGLDAELKLVVTDWQIRIVDGAPEPNDHTHAAYDERVLARLRSLQQSVVAFLEPLSSNTTVMGYCRRFTAAAAAAEAGARAYVASPAVDSFHSIWFELHEYLIRLAGRTRGEEAAAGRAG